MDYTELLIEADQNNLITRDKSLLAYDGRIKDNRIAIRRDMPNTQKKCVLAEELGHYHTTVGDILGQASGSDKKQELRARAWAYNRLIGLVGILRCYEAGCQNRYEMAELLDVTEDFLEEALSYYTGKYGTFTIVDNYVIYFKPTLAVLKR